MATTKYPELTYGADSSGTTYRTTASSSTTGILDVDIRDAAMPYYEIATCSKCKKEEEVYKDYNWSNDPNLTRKICRKCHTKTMDKLYGLDNNVDTEELLYGNQTD